MECQAPCRNASRRVSFNGARPVRRIGVRDRRCHPLGHHDPAVQWRIRMICTVCMSLYTPATA